MSKFFNGKLKYLTLFLAGAVADLALAPFQFFPILFVSFPIFFKILDAAKTRKQAFLIGWTLGFGYFVFGLYWIANSLLVDAERFAWLVPFAVCGIPFGLAIYIGLFSLAYHGFSKKFEPSARVILFATLWVIFELLRTWLFTGFPWNLIGYTALFSYDFSQIAALGGVYLLSYLVIILSLLPVYYKNKHMLVGLLLVAILGIIFDYHHLKFDTVDSSKTAKVMIFQPNIEQTLKNDELEAKRQFIENIDYMKYIENKNADIILWPESGVPYDLSHHPSIAGLLSEVAPENGLLVTGALRSEGETHEDYRIWNTLYAISKHGIYESYDKIHLVPFGEFVPFRKYLPLDKITPGSLDFSSGEKRPIIRYNNGPGFLPLICYEVIFPEFAAAKANIKDRPDYIVNITNDGWFGNSTGPYQHLAMARIRAIEQGVPLLRAANTGVSAVIGPDGQILDSLDLNKRGYLSDNLELNKITTIYSIYGDWIILGLIISSMTALLIFRKKH